MTLQDFYKLWPIGFTLIAMAIGKAVTYGKERQKMESFVTKEELGVHCEATRRRWSDEIGTKIAGVSSSIKSMETKMENLVIRLHNSQSKKIEAMDEKREDAKGESSQQFINLNKAIGRLEGKIEQIKGKG